MKAQDILPQSLLTLAQQPLFKDLSPTEVAAVLKSGVLVKAEQGTPIYRQGERARATFLVVEGEVHLAQEACGGPDSLIRVSGPGQPLAVVTEDAGDPYPATAMPKKPTTLVRWDAAEFDRLLIAHPKLARNLVRNLWIRLREMQERFAESSGGRVERRLAAALVRQCDQVGRAEGDGIRIDSAASRKDLARLVGTTLFSISRILQQWQASGWVKSGRERLTILDRAALCRIAGLSE